MSAKSAQLIVIILFRRARWHLKAISLFILLSALPALAQIENNSSSIEEFNAQVEAREQTHYQKFQSVWFAFLENKTQQIPSDLTPAFVRKATENFLTMTGGLKAKFAQASRTNDFVFTLTKPDDDPYRKASFHRSHRSIFMDLETVESKEWLILFVHEVAHSLDSELLDALPIYNDEAYIKELSAYGKANGTLSNLPLQDRKRLDNWLLAGLNRGFLAEYRAWLLTLVIYEEGLRDGTFSPSPWLEQLKNSKSKNDNMRTHILRYLSPSWTDPTEEIFEHPFIQEALRNLRRKLNADPSLVKLGAIEKLLTP